MTYTKEIDDETIEIEEEDFSHINYFELSLSNLYEPEIHRSTDEVMYEEFIIDKFKDSFIKEPLETYIKNHLLIFQSLPSSDEILDCKIDLKRYLVPDDDEIREMFMNITKQNN